MLGALLSYLMHAECHTSPEDSEVGAVWSALLSTREISGHGDSRSERTLRDRRSCMGQGVGAGGIHGDCSQWQSGPREGTMRQQCRPGREGLGRTSHGFGGR